MYTEIPLPSTGYAFLRDRLGGGLTLGSMMLHRLDIEKGRLSAVLDSKFSPEDIAHHDFKSSMGRRIVYLTDADAFLQDKINRHLSEGSSNVCILADWLQRPEDPRMKSSRTRILRLGEEVYHILIRADAFSYTVAEFIKSKTNWPTVISLASLESVEHVPMVGDPPVAVSPDFLAAVADNTHYIVTDLYDAETFMIWTKS